MASPAARWERLQALFEQAASLPPGERSGYLATACNGDLSLLAEVEAMLAAESPQYALGIERLVSDERLEPADPLIGMRLGAWRVLEPIGRGGMGAVYLAERDDGHYEQRVALKIVGASASSHAATLFQAERRILARLTHPNIARLLDAGFTPEGSAFMAMELVEGEPITAWCDSRRLSLEDRLGLFVLVCRATQHAHQALVVHRDLKPSNIFVSRHGDVKLLDFGVAKLLETDAGMPELATREHRAVTLAYAAPEQLRGNPVTTATDVYALGVVLYELLVGRRPFAASGTSPLEIERLITSTEPPAPSQAAWRPAGSEEPGSTAAVRNTTAGRLAKRLRGDLDRIVLKALRPDAGRRYASAGHLAEDIERYLAGRPVLAQPDSLGYRVRRFVGRHRLGVAAAASLAVVFAAFVVVTLVQARRIAAERDRAQLEQGRAEQMVRLLVDLFETANPDVVPGGDSLPIGAFLERAELRALRELEGQPDLAGRMRHVLGLVHYARSNYPRARGLLEAALDEQRSVSGADALAALEIQVDLARLLVWIDRREDARALLDDGLERIVRVHGSDHRLAADAYWVLAEALPDVEAARSYLEQAVGIARRRLPPFDRDRIRYTTGLAAAHLRLRRFEEARALFDEAHRGAEALNDGRTTIMIGLLNDSAVLDAATGNFAAAEVKHRRTYALATDLLGADSFQVANALNNLAVALTNQGRIEEAADAFMQSHARHVALFGEDHWRTINTMRNIGMSMLLVDRPRECELWMRRAVDASDRSPDVNARAEAYLRAQLARCLIRDGRADDGIALLEPAIATLREVGASAGSYAANASLWLGRALLEAGQIDRAEPLVAAAAQYYGSGHPADHPARADAECELAHVKAARGALAEALALAEACVPRIAGYGQVEPWRRRSAAQLLERLRAGARQDARSGR